MLRRPVPVALAVTVVLVLVGLPFLRANLSRVDDRVLPASAETRVAAEQVRTDYSSSQLGGIEVVVPNFPSDDANPRRCYDVVEAACVDLDAYARALFEIEGVDSVSTERGIYTANLFAMEVPIDVVAAELSGGGGGGSAVDLRILPSYTDAFADVGVTRLVLTPAFEPISDEGEALVDTIRSLESPFGAVLVTGDAARVKDLGDVLSERIPWAIGWIAVSTIVVLILMLGAPLIPIKALLLNLLSLTATFGAMVWVFQDGNPSGVLGFDATGSIDMFTPILMFCIAFGLSMDYEVFLLSRIKEEYDISGDNERAVEVGLGKTGPIVTAAALLLALVFAAIATSSVTVVKMLGVGMVIAVISDAFLIRATLVPAFMKLAGSANWWAPSWLRRWHLRWGMWENEVIEIGD